MAAIHIRHWISFRKRPWIRCKHMPPRHADRAGEGSARSAALIEIEATVIGGGLGIEPSQVQAQLREGKIATLCERGIGEDQGFYRVTFYYGKRRFRILMDESGNVSEEPKRA